MLLWGDCFAPIEGALSAVTAETRAHLWNELVSTAQITAREAVRMTPVPTLVAEHGQRHSPRSPREQPPRHIAGETFAVIRAMLPVADCGAPVSPDAKHATRAFVCQWFLQSRPVLQPSMMRVSSCASYVSAELRVESGSFARGPMSPRETVSERMQTVNALDTLTVALRVSPMLLLSTSRAPPATLLLSPRTGRNAALAPDTTIPPFWLHYSTPITPGATFRASA
jgi:hypothetical protein